MEDLELSKLQYFFQVPISRVCKRVQGQCIQVDRYEDGQVIPARLGRVVRCHLLAFNFSEPMLRNQLLYLSHHSSNNSLRARVVALILVQPSGGGMKTPFGAHDKS